MPGWQGADGSMSSDGNSSPAVGSDGLTQSERTFADSLLLWNSDGVQHVQTGEGQWETDDFHVNGQLVRVRVDTPRCSFSSSPFAPSFSEVEECFGDFEASSLGVAHLPSHAQEMTLAGQLSQLQLGLGSCSGCGAEMPTLQASETPFGGNVPHALHCPSGPVLSSRRVLQPPLSNPLRRPADDVETSEPLVRSQVFGASAIACHLQTIPGCTGFKWSAKARFNTKLSVADVDLHEFGSPNVRHMKNVNVALTVLDPTKPGGKRDIKFRGRLQNSDQRKPEPGWLILQFLDIPNDDLPFLNCAARCVRQFVDEAVFAACMLLPGSPFASPSYQLLFHGTIEYNHSKLSSSDATLRLLKLACDNSPTLRCLEFTRCRSRSPLCILAMFPAARKARSVASFKVEIYPTQFKVTERYEDQDMTGPEVEHKHLPVVEELRAIIDGLVENKRQAGSEASSQMGSSSRGGGGCAAAAPAVAGEAPHDDSPWETDLVSDDSDYGDAPGRHDGDFLPGSCKHFRDR